MNPQTYVILDKVADKLITYIKGTKVQANSEVTIDLFVQQRLPEIISLAQTVLADGRITFTELTRIVTFTSTTVRDSLDIYTKANQAEKLGVVREIIQFLVSELYKGDSKIKSFILDDKNLDGLINLVYQISVKWRG